MPATLQGWQSLLYKDSLTVYRIDERDRDNRGNPLGYRQAFAGEKCQMHATPNFDEDGPAGQSKKDNVMTADKVTCALSLDIRAEDVAKVETWDGRTIWGKVAGATKDRSGVAGIALTSYQAFFIVPTVAPAIVEGTWNG